LPAAQSFQPRPTPGIGPLGSTRFSGCSQVFTHMVEVAEEAPLSLKDLLGLQLNPFDPVGYRMNLTVEPQPASRTQRSNGVRFPPRCRRWRRRW
jgi:hypothetical protein